MNKYSPARSTLGKQCRQWGARLLLPAAFLLTPSLSVAETQLFDGIIAIVDDDVVLASQFQNRLRQVEANIKKSGKQAPPMEKIQREILDQLILESIQIQMSYRAGVRISDEQLNQSMQGIASQNRMSLLDFKAALEADGLSYAATREQIRREMLIQRVQQGNVNQRVQITDQEIKNFLASEEGQNLTAAEYRVLHTLIATSNSDAGIELKARRDAERIYKAISNGADYAKTMAGENLKPNDLGWRKLDDIPSLLAEVVPTLSEGDTAKPLQSSSGFHLIKLLDKRGDGEVIPQTHARHILLKTSAIRDESATESAINDLRKRALAGEDFAELARQYSEDIGSAVEGGDLNWTSPGQLVPAFQKAMDTTDINEISPAFRSQYGWHVLQVQGRRDKDVTEDLRKNIARNFIHKRKFADELSVWLQKIRDEAYVDIK